MAATIGKVRAVFTASTSGLVAGVNAASASMKRMESSVASLRGPLNSIGAIQGAQLFGSIISGAGQAASALIGIGAIQGAQLFGSIISGAGQAASALMGIGRSAAPSIAQAVDLATSLGEETSKSGVLFGAAAGQVAQFAESASSIGLSNAAALQATGTFGNLFKSMGLGEKQAAEYATTMTSLGADLASFNNASVEEAVQAVGAALRGESEPIRRFGVLLDEATLKQEALNAGLIRSTKGSLTPAIKAQAAYAAILKQTAAAQGDFQRTSGSLANLGRIVQAQTSNIFTDIGKAFEPLFRSSVSAFSSVLNAVRPFVQDVAKGVQSSLEIIGTAVQNLVPMFTAFLGGLDGGALGERISKGILAGAIYLAGVADYIVAEVPKAWQYVSQVGGQWSGVFDAGRRVASFFAGVGRFVAGAFQTVVLAFTGIGQAIVTAVRGVASSLGFDTSGLDVAVAALQGFNQQLEKDVTASFNAAGENFGAAFGDTAATAGKELAGPISRTLDEAIAAAREAADGIDVAATQTVEVKQTVTVDAKQAIQGIESRSAEGIKEMFRIMRGDVGDQTQERIARGVERIADNTEDMGDPLDLEVADLAPAAGG